MITNQNKIQGGQLTEVESQIKMALKSQGVHMSHQRLAILEYLVKNRTHPDAEQIYSALIGEMPTLSRTTVYNTLNLFVEAGILKKLQVGTNAGCYDIESHEHGHFCCSTCGKIYNFELGLLLSQPLKLDGFDIQEQNIIMRGICPKCR